MNLFDAATSRQLRDQGLAITASYPNDDWLAKAKHVAEQLAAQNGEVTSDDVLRKCPRPESVNPNTTGNIFKGKKWKCVGFTNSEKISRHAGIIRRWILIS